MSLDEGRLSLDRSPEPSLVLFTDDQGEPLRYLTGCTVELSGPRLLRRVWVRDWSVITAFDGSTPYVGTLRRWGDELLIDDRGAGVSFRLDGDGADGLEVYEGQLVMVMGFVVGPQRVQVMGWRPLVEISAGSAGPP